MAIEQVGSVSPAAPVDGGDATPWWVGLRERWRDWRHQTVARPGFQRWAAAFPLTRPVARTQARELFDLVAGFVYSQVLLACVRLRVFDALAAGPLSLAQLAQRVGLPAEGAERLVAAAVALRLLERRRGARVALGQLGAPMVGNGAIAAMVEHHATLYADLTDPVALLRREARPGMAGYWPYAALADQTASAEATAGATGGVGEKADKAGDGNEFGTGLGTGPGAGPASLDGARVAEYSALMTASQPLVTEQVLAAYRFDRHRVLLDVGCGEGSFAAAVAAQAPRLRLMLFDLPAVAERARERLAGLGLADRCRTYGGDFFRDPLPAGADLVSLVRVCFDHPDERVLRLLRNVRQALPDHGHVLLAEPLAGERGVEAMGDAYFGFYLLAMGRGRTRTVDELDQLLQAAGFEPAQVRPTHLPLNTGLIVARCRRKP
jgi:demethylspheroidene O-methyltransferase